jgi:pimeloyl-ACP methyl ester carboxylesterase
MDLAPIAQSLARRVLVARGVASRSVPTSAGELHLYDAPGGGDLPTTLVLHGMGSSAAPFARVVQALRGESRRVLAPDALGHGLSAVPEGPLTVETMLAALLELFDREVREPAVVFGNSLGGGLALRLALERPTQVRALVVCSPAGAPMDRAELDRFLRVFDLRSRADARAFLARLYHRTPWYAPLMADSVRGLLARPHIRDLLAAVEPEHAIDPAELRLLKMPIMLIWGQSERLLPDAHFEFFRRSLPAHAVIERPHGFGHSPQLERPVELARRIATFARAALARPVR